MSRIGLPYIRALFLWLLLPVTAAPQPEPQQADDVTHEIANLKDPEFSIREAAAYALAHMGDARAVPARSLPLMTRLARLVNGRPWPLDN